MGKILCKFIVIIEKCLYVNFHIYFISCSTRYWSGSSICFLHFIVSTEVLDKSLTINQAKMKEKMPSVVEAVEQLGHSGTVGRNVNCYKIFWKPVC